MKILLHQCCGPCSIYLIEELIKSNFIPTIYFYNPNIHPISEYYKRLDSAIKVCISYNVEFLIEEEYGLDIFIKHNLNNNEPDCEFCYLIRMKKSIEKASQLGITYYTTSLLYSKMQKHELLYKVAKKYAKKYNINFYYNDFRSGWQEGIEKSKKLELYRQNYCGCIFSERIRFQQQLSNKLNKKYHNVLKNSN